MSHKKRDTFHSLDLIILNIYNFSLLQKNLARVCNIPPCEQIVSHKGGMHVNTHESQTTLEDFENAVAVFEELLDHLETLKAKEDCSPGRIIHLNTYPHSCPRCEEVTRTVTADPYCPNCNWDSVSDPYLRGLKWAS